MDLLLESVRVLVSDIVSVIVSIEDTGSFLSDLGEVVIVHDEQERTKKTALGY